MNFTKKQQQQQLCISAKHACKKSTFLMKFYSFGVELLWLHMKSEK